MKKILCGFLSLGLVFTGDAYARCEYNPFEWVESGNRYGVIGNPSVPVSHEVCKREGGPGVKSCYIKCHGTTWKFDGATHCESGYELKGDKCEKKAPASTPVPASTPAPKQNYGTGVCAETKYTLPKGGDSAYDDYLYTSTAKYEKRKEGQTVTAYVCGQGYCKVNETMRLKNAAIGSGAGKSDAVYKCVNVPDSDRTGYGWQATAVDSYCSVGKNKFKYNKTLKLYEYNGKYCAEINEVKEVANVLNINQTNIVQNITANVNIDVTEVYNITVKNVKINKKLSASDIAKIQKMINKSEAEIRKDLAAIGAVVEELQADVNQLQREQFWDDLTNSFQNARLNGLTRQMRNMKAQLKTKVNEDQVMDLINGAIKDMELTDEQVAQVKQMIEASARKTKMDINKINSRLNSLSWRVTKNEAQIAWVRFYNNLRNNSQDRQIQSLGDKLADMEKKMLTEKDVEDLIEAELKTARLNRTQLQQVRTQISVATRGLKIKLDRLTKRVDELEAELDAVKSDLTKVKVQTWFDRLKNNFINKSQDQKIKSLGNQIDRLKKDIKERPTEDEVMDMIQDAIDSAELNDTQLAQVKSMIDSEISALGGDVQKLRKRLNGLSVRVAKLEVRMWWNEVQDKVQSFKIDKLNRKMRSMQSQINDKMSEDQVMDLIEEALSEAELSETQTKQVEAMIRESARKAHARMDKIDNRLNRLSQKLLKVQWDVFKLKGKLALVDFENDVRYKALRAKDAKFDKAIKGINADIKSIEKQLDSKISQAEARRLIQTSVDNAVAELGNDLSAEIQATFNQIVQDLNNVVAELVGEIESRLAKVEADVAALQAENQVLLSKIASLQSLSASQRSQINSLRAEIAKKTTAEEVVALILENTQSLSDGQKQEVVALIIEYTQKLSAGQKAQVEALIASYVDPQIKQLNADVSKVRQQEVARDKINSAMSVLNAFASGADVSVWKNAEGKFNTARLASDTTAGVVLGTAGGLISNSIIKKNQIKKGFEDINCSVGGQVVSNYADEFMVGMQ